jgi:hypothetical protein
MSIYSIHSEYCGFSLIFISTYNLSEIIEYIFLFLFSDKTSVFICLIFFSFSATKSNPTIVNN